jgi:DNA repair exonuclease SbcCD ATPase subunit
MSRSDGVEYFFDWEHDNEPDNIRALALKLAIERGGQTCPVCEYDFVYAREIVTGEVKEIDRLRRELSSKTAELLATREALSAAEARVMLAATGRPE